MFLGDGHILTQLYQQLAICFLLLLQHSLLPPQPLVYQACFLFGTVHTLHPFLQLLSVLPNMAPFSVKLVHKPAGRMEEQVGEGEGEGEGERWKVSEW